MHSRINLNDGISGLVESGRSWGLASLSLSHIYVQSHTYLHQWQFSLV